MKYFILNVESIFYVSIHFEHHFDFDTNASKSLVEIHQDIMAEINDKTSHALKFIESINVFLSFYFVYIIVKWVKKYFWKISIFNSFKFERALRFRYKYLTNLRYKNFYITKKFHEIDTRRNEMGMDTIMPLTYRERKYFVEMSSIRTIWQEWHHIFSSSITLTYSTFHLISIMIADYSLFWLLSMIKFYGNQTDDGIESEGEKIQVLKIFFICIFNLTCNHALQYKFWR